MDDILKGEIRFQEKIFTSHNLDLNSHLVNRASR
eukprot:UN20505